MDTVAGTWTPSEATRHINNLELEAIARAVSHWSRLLGNHIVTVFSDNTTAVACVNRQGGTKSHQLFRLTESLLLRCLGWNITLTASYLAGKDNVMADALSRGRFSNGDWTINLDWAKHLFSDLRVPERGPVCRRGQLSSPGLLLQTVSPPSLEDRRVLLPLGQPLPVRLPSMEPGPKGSDEVPVFIECGDDPSSSLLAESTLVSVAATAPVGPSAETPLQPIPTNSAEGSGMVQGHRKSSSFSMEVIRERLHQAGISEEASSVACESTIRAYDSRLDRFTAWAADNSCDPVEATVVQVVNFLTTIFREGKQTGTVRNYRSAIAAIHKGFDDGSTVGNNQIIAQLLRGMFHQRPSQVYLRLGQLTRF